MAIRSPAHQQHHHHGQAIGDGTEQVDERRGRLGLGQGIGDKPWDPETEAIEAGGNPQIEDAQQPQTPVSPERCQSVDCITADLTALPLLPQDSLQGLGLFPL